MPAGIKLSYLPLFFGIFKSTDKLAHYITSSHSKEYNFSCAKICVRNVFCKTPESNLTCYITSLQSKEYNFQHAKICIEMYFAKLPKVIQLTWRVQVIFRFYIMRKFLSNVIFVISMCFTKNCPNTIISQLLSISLSSSQINKQQ